MTYEVPQYRNLIWPALQAVIALGGSASISELDDAVIERENISPEVQAQISPDGRRSQLQYRLAWARTYLKGMGLLTNSQRGVWAVTDLGQTVTEDQIPEMLARIRAEFNSPSGRGKPDESDVDIDLELDVVEAEAETDWKSALLKQLSKLSPEAFERLAQRLLREAGFSSAVVTGRSGDGGIDGLGVYQLSLLSFPVFFQCKRYSGSVGAPHVRDFRGAMAGRGDKGLLITTGAFTNDARKEARRDGAPPIDLIDGDQLCELLKDFSLGTSTHSRIVEEVTIDAGFFASLEPK